MISVVLTDAENPPNRKLSAAEDGSSRERWGFENETHIAQPLSLTTRLVEGGCITSIAVGRTGRATRLPPQFGQTSFRTSVAQDSQKVHSNVHILARASGGKSLSQHSQLGRSSSISILFATSTHIQSSGASISSGSWAGVALTFRRAAATLRARSTSGAALMCISCCGNGISIPFSLKDWKIA